MESVSEDIDNCLFVTTVLTMYKIFDYLMTITIPRGPLAPSLSWFAHATQCPYKTNKFATTLPSELDS